MTFFSKKFRSGFTIIELLVVLSVIATLSIVAYASTQVIQTNRYNTKRIADVATLSNAMEAQYMQTKTVPDPTANRQYYDQFGGYQHSASGAYGVTSLFSEDILGKSALAYHPRDPDTDSYYAFGKLLQYSPEYQIGAVLRVDGVPTAYIRGTYTHTELNSLIRGYNTNTFAIDGGTTSLPYNPYKKEVTAYIIESSGSVAITPNKSLTGPLGVNDTITVGTGGLAVLKVSDGTELIVGSTASESKLSLTSLELKDDSGLFTKVRGMLAVGEVVAKAPKLRNIGGANSELEIQTNNAVAAVRGTIFAVKVAQEGGAISTFTLISGSLQMAETTPTATMTVTGSGVVNDIITVKEGETPVSIDVTSRVATSKGITDSTDPVLVAILDRLDVAIPIESTLITPEQVSFVSAGAGGTSSDVQGSVVMAVVPGTDLIKINGVALPVNPDGQKTTLLFTPAQGGSYSFEYCKVLTGVTKCSRPYIINIPNPQVGTVPLESLAPIVENKIAMVSLSGATVDSEVVSVTPTQITNTSSGTNTASGSVTTSVVNYCGELGVVNSDGLKMIGCADYTKSNINMTFATGTNYSNKYIASKGTSVANNSSGVYIPYNKSNSFLKYTYATTNFPSTTEFEFGLLGADLLRGSTQTGTYYIFDGGGDLKLFMRGNMFHIKSDGLFNKQDGQATVSLVEIQKSIPANINSNDIYTVKIRVTSNPNISIDIKKVSDSTWTNITTAEIGRAINIGTNSSTFYAITVGSTIASAGPVYLSNPTIGQWDGYISYFRILTQN